MLCVPSPIGTISSASWLRLGRMRTAGSQKVLARPDSPDARGRRLTAEVARLCGWLLIQASYVTSSVSGDARFGSSRFLSFGRSFLWNWLSFVPAGVLSAGVPRLPPGSLLPPRGRRCSAGRRLCCLLRGVSSQECFFSFLRAWPPSLQTPATRRRGSAGSAGARPGAGAARGRTRPQLAVAGRARALRRRSPRCEAELRAARDRCPSSVTTFISRFPV